MGMAGATMPNPRATTKATTASTRTSRGSCGRAPSPTGGSSHAYRWRSATIPWRQVERDLVAEVGTDPPWADLLDVRPLGEVDPGPVAETDHLRHPVDVHHAAHRNRVGIRAGWPRRRPGS